MSKTHDVLISGFDLDRLEAELQAERALADRLAEIVEVGIEDLDDGDWPQAFAALAAWKEARND